MVWNKTEAITHMNQWGRERVPFLFLIDFEMKKILIFKLNENLPQNIAFVFPDASFNPKKPSENNTFSFNKFPIPIEDYSNAFNKVSDSILRGDTFLLNLTFPTSLETNITLGEIFERSSARYKLFVEDQFVVFSPETFITIRDRTIVSCPMKGTIRASEPDAENAILNNTKELAEHNTIVDLIRNDLSLIASEVTVKRFRYIDRIHTNQGELLQVSSEITGLLPEDYNEHIGNLIFKLLPAGSVSGAPKSKTIDIIKTVEKEERGYYTGVCGYFDGESLDSAVMIRYIEKYQNGLRFRSGGGITCNSIMEDEYHELIDKVYVPFN